MLVWSHSKPYWIWLLLYLKWWEPEIALEINWAIDILYFYCENKQLILTQLDLNFTTSLLNIFISISNILENIKSFVTEEPSSNPSAVILNWKMKNESNLPQVDVGYTESEIRFSRNYCAKANKQIYLFGNADELSLSWPYWEWFFVSMFILLFSSILLFSFPSLNIIYLIGFLQDSLCVTKEITLWQLFVLQLL